uniref:Ig-like domain-containing protein n=1 Tax=Mastacembelus armatus TaxID=205130 RepID=A0A3Q3L1D2_9TELE
MRSFTLVTTLFLCSLGKYWHIITAPRNVINNTSKFKCWVSVSGSESQTVQVQPGEEVTLLCTNFTRFPSHITWFRLGNGSNTSCISTMLSSETSAVPCDGPQNLKFNMTSNTTTLFLTVRPVDLSDSGLYFCGFYMAVNGEHKVIVSATYLKVQGKTVVNSETDVCPFQSLSKGLS